MTTRGLPDNPGDYDSVQDRKWQFRGRISVMLVERDIVLGNLVAAIDAAENGQGGIVIISGSAGLGKTSVLEALRDLASERCDIFWGGCDALFTPRPLGPLHDMRPAFEPGLSALLDSSAAPHKIFETIIDEIAHRKKAVLVVVEDVHWADHATLDFLKFLGRRIAQLRAVLLISYRDDEVDAEHPLNQVLGELPQSRVNRIMLSPLSQKGVEVLGDGHGADLSHIFEVTGGNPFFVTELLANEGNTRQDIPASVREAVNARLNRLPSSERVFLETLSIVPGAVGTRFLHKMFDDASGDIVAACVRKKLLSQDNEQKIRFRHELARLATLSRLSASQQKLIHSKTLETLLQLAPEPALDWIVHHAAGALAGSVVLEYAPKAARQAASVGSHREAAAHYATALKFVDEAEPPLAAQLYQNWAYEAGLALRIDNEVLEARRHAISLWRALDRPEKVGENLRWLSRLHWYRGESARASHFADEAVRVLETAAPSAERAMAYSLRSQFHMLNSRMEQAISWGRRALALAEEFNNIEARIHALNNVGFAMVFQDQPDGVDALLESLSLAHDHQFHEHAARVYTNLSEHAVDFRKFTLAEEYISRGIAFDSEHDLDAWIHYLVGILARLRLEQGRLHNAEAVAKGVLGLKRLTLLMRLPALTVLARVRMRFGCRSADALLSEVLENAISTDEVQYVIPARLALVENAWLADRKDEAVIQLDALGKIAPLSFHKWNRGEFAVWAHRFGHDVPREFFLNLPDPFDLELTDDISGAADSWAALNAPYSAALTLMQVNGGDGEKSLAAALKILLPMEAGRAIEKARALARKFNVAGKMPRGQRGPYGSAREHVLGFTKKEQEVFALIAAGATNIEIAEKLSRSKRTIEHHVSAVLAKMNVGNRMEAIVRSQNEPWLLGREHGQTNSLNRNV